MDYRVLGPLEVRDGDRRCEIGGPKQRTVVAVLVAAAGRPVAVDALLHAVYGDDAAPSSRRSLQTAVSHLRHSIGLEIEHRSGAYRIALDGATVDAIEFEAAVNAARSIAADSPGSAAAALRTALALWRGLPYADVEAHGALDAEMTRLAELRLVGLEHCFDAELAAGRHREVIAELASLSAEHPWRESLTALHMTALYRAGRQTDALRAYERTRTALVDELGVDPSPDLRDLERRILAHDRSLLGTRSDDAFVVTDSTEAGSFHALTNAGVLTFVFTDVEASTRLLRELGAGYDDAIAEHHRIVRAALQRHGGEELSNDGDGFVAAFADADDALAAAVDVQREIDAAPWPAGHPMHVRIGIHTGFARVGPTGYSALALHQAARVVGAAHGGQIYLTRDTRDRLARTSGDIEVISLGRYSVRDFDEPVELFTVLGDGMTERRAAPRVRPADRHNLVVPTTSLVGRAEERRRLGEVIAGAGRSRLVTLLGPGGVGKTRLAVEVAIDLADRWDDGVWFVGLAAVDRPDLVDAAVADALGATRSGVTSQRSRLLDHLGSRATLVVLDNCEHVSGAVAEMIADLLAACSRTAVLATSRSPLGLRSERIVHLAPLAVDVAGASTTGDASAWPAALQLFSERAGGVRAEELAVAVELCRELDGLPLAIELAAARARTVPLRDLAARLRRTPALLASSDPGLPERHRSLARVLDWSVELLEPRQLRVLQRLSVCVGGFDLDTVIAVCSSPDGEESADDECDGDEAVVDDLWTLVDGSLVAVDETAGETRYRLLTTVRSHVTARADPVELATGWSHLADHLLRRVGPHRELDRAWIDRMATELTNVRAVVDHAATPVRTAQALAWSVGKYHELTDRFAPAVDELRRWDDMRPDPTPERVAVLTLLADLSLHLGDLEPAATVLDAAGAVAESCGLAPWDSAGLVRASADLAMRRGDTAEAIELVESELAAAHPPRAEARLWDLLGIARWMAGDTDGALAAFEAELVAAAASGDEAILVNTYGNLAEAELQLGDPVAAARHQLSSLELARAHHHPVAMAFSMMIAARLVGTDGRHDEAVRLQIVADTMLAAARFEMYVDDRERCDALLGAAADALRRDEFDRVSEEGRTMAPDAAAELATRVLARAAGVDTADTPAARAQPASSTRSALTNTTS